MADRSTESPRAPTHVEDEKCSQASHTGLDLYEDEKTVLDRQTAGPTTYLGPARFLLSCTTKVDGVILMISSIAAIVGGVGTPLAMLLLGSMGQSFRGYFIGDTDLKEFNSQVHQICLFYVYVAVGEFVAIYIATVGFTMVGERIAQQIREKYMAAIFRQNIAYFECIGVSEINNRLTIDTNLIQDAITGKASLTLSAIATFVSAFIISFAKSWRLALVLLPALVLIVGSMTVGAACMVKYTKRALGAYSRGASVAEEAISSIETVTAFGMQQRLVNEYKKHIAAARLSGLHSGVALAVMIAIMNGVIFWSYGLAFWQGSRWMVNDQISLSAIITILFATITGAFALGNVSPHTQAFVSGVTATSKISQAICRTSPIDSSQSTGEKLSVVEGTIELRSIRHVYPSRPGVLVLDGLNLHFPAGKMTALVGPSGCGKSTIVGLLERLYDPISGTIYLDGHNITDLNVSWLRQQIGLVSQEPTLFSTTIFENIRYGLIGTQYEHASLKEIEHLIEQSTKTANAYDFIMALPDGFQTHVGDQGGLLSGGQKQRIAIARAIVGEPRILLLDEATSALDVKAERAVQKALDHAARGRTTIVIAHRLSTITAADNIVVMSAGRVVEQGTHHELLAKQSVYQELVKQQTIQAKRVASIAQHDDVGLQDQDPNDLVDIKNGKGQTTPLTNSEKATVHQSHDIIRKDSTWALIKFVFQLHKDGVYPIIGGLFFSLIAGASHPTQAIFLAKIIEALSLKSSMYNVLRHNVNYWCWMYLMIGFTTVIGWLGQGVCFAYYSQRLIYTARKKGLDTIVHQDIGQFFLPESSSSRFTTLLSTSATQIQGLSGVTLGTLLIILTTLIAGFVLAVAIGWKLALVCTCTIPIQLGCGILRLKCVAILEGHSKKVSDASAAYAREYSTGIRTVAALSLERFVQGKYHDILEEQRRKSLLQISQSSILYAASQSLNFLCAALAFWYGSRLISTDHYSMFQFFVCYTTIIVGAYSAGAVFSFAPDIGKAKSGAQDMKRLFDRPVRIDARQEGGISVSRIGGSIEFQNVSFRYPNRPEHLILEDVNLAVQPGQYVALVGESGSGKSTIVSLIERFYDPESGMVMVDDIDVKAWNLRDYRGHLALVGQNPALYDGTIRDNILLGAEGEVSDAAIVQACKDANIYDFVCSLPDGFATIVGARGAMLSGGQKQRIAIARALLRNPRILLLDEATSALDSESEKIVQEALDAATRGRTTVAVAHRISTVQNADCIYVLERGRIVEQGNHQSLLELRGRYYELVQIQNFGRT
ncbi:P-loop containing nucleoside triphosphate hydrolase protein [Aspergillus pseudotamarii]|uniref:P-loop containing nucleoside triphosphate hydrolase protein n=1 Tax=Aspergillus pseudotamarii TaxID=132259 RepID=A0A5N6TBZ7_ASPPS|nr:P-loop containing nucleoside triphosphate hydrolase protein [Aspergillus pseudotamarii]KAE8143651.1 P-loop containing nucleoside triphosphate hydrolase protein [Aspergillus pseudotamarii]